MPAPDPNGVWFVPVGTGFIMECDMFEVEGRTHRKQRALRFLKRFRMGADKCRCCGEHLGTWRRTDAIYCRESCRKKAARARRVMRKSTGAQ